MSRFKRVYSCLKKEDCPFQFQFQSLIGYNWCGQNLVVKGARCSFKYKGIGSDVAIKDLEHYPEHKQIIEQLRSRVSHQTNLHQEVLR